MEAQKILNSQKKKKERERKRKLEAQFLILSLIKPYSN